MIEDDQLPNLVSVYWMRTWIDNFKSRFGCSLPFQLPRFEGGNAIYDYSVPWFGMPVDPDKLPRNELGSMLRPLAKLCGKYRGHVMDGAWAYRWFYYELLDRDGRLRPLCWVSPRLLHADLDLERVGEKVTSWSPLFLEQTWRYEPAEYERAADRFMAHWRQHERLWVSKGLLRYDGVDGWLSQLRFEAKAGLEERKCWTTEAGHFGPDGPWELENAWFPGLRWDMVPLYDRRQCTTPLRAMKEDLFKTSVFNPAANARQSAVRWRQLESRFGIRFVRTSHEKSRSREREDRIVALFNEGFTKRQIAEVLIDEGLHPLNEAYAAEARRSSAKDRKDWVDAAYETVRAITRKLRGRKDSPISRRPPN